MMRKYTDQFEFHELNSFIALKSFEKLAQTKTN